MSEHNSNNTKPEQSLESFVLEINKIPKEHWSHLFQIIRLYGESLTKKPISSSDAWAKAVDEVTNPDPVLKAARQKALSELLRKWEDEGDEEEQTETAEILRKALEEDSISV